MAVPKGITKIFLLVYLGAVVTGTAYAVVPIVEAAGGDAGGMLLTGYSLSVGSPKSYRVAVANKAAATVYESLPGHRPNFGATPVYGGGVGAATFSSLAAPTALYTGVPWRAATRVRQLSFLVSAVPEAKPWITLLAGIALIAYQLRRKNKLRGIALSIG